MASEWPQVSLGEVITLQRGFDLPSRDRKPGKVPIISSSGITDYHSEVGVQGPGVVTGRYGTIGQVFLIKEDFWPLNTTLWVKNFHGNDPLWASYLLRTIDFMSCSDKSSVPGVNRNDLHQLLVLLPPIDEQRTIASVLGALDDKIEQNRRTARALERLAQAVFRAWFVDFEPVKAKAADAASFPFMPQTIFDALPTHFVDSEIGSVPEGWEVSGTPSIATLSKMQVNPQEHTTEVFDHFSIPAFDADMRAVVEFGEAIKSNKFLVSEGCVLLSKLNPRIARIWLPPPPRGRRQIASTEFLVFVPRSAFDRHYLYCQFQQSSFREELAQVASGTSNSHQRVRPDDVLHKTVIVPPSSVRKGFADIAEPLFALSAANHAESAKLAEVREYLLPRLFSGNVRVDVTHG